MYPSITNITIETSSFCNAECIICPNSQTKYKRKSHLMSLEDFENTLKLFPNLNSIYLSGCYEPLSDNRLPQIFNIVKKANPNINITIFSNGSLLNKWIDLILNTENLSSIIFSVHGYSNESYNKIMKNLDRDTVYNNIIKLINKRNELGKNTPKISVTSLRLSSNIHELEEFKKFWKQQKIDYVHSFELMNWNNKVDNYDSLIDKPKLITRLCPMYEFPIVIDAFCNVVRCCYDVSFSYGNVFKDGVDKYLAKRRISTTYPDWDCIKCDGWKI